MFTTISRSVRPSAVIRLHQIKQVAYVVRYSSYLAKVQPPQDAMSASRRFRLLMSIPVVSITACQSRSHGFDSQHKIFNVDFPEGVYRSGLLANENINYVENLWPEKVVHLYDAFLNGMEMSKNGPCFGHYEADSNTFKFCTYKEADEMATHFGSALVNKFKAPVSNNTRIGIYAKNSPEVFLTMLGCMRHKMVHVPIYDTLGCDAASYIVGHSEIHTMVVDKADKLERMIYRKTHDNLTSLEHIVVVDMADVTPEIIQKAEEAGLTVSSWEDTLQYGKEHPAEPTFAEPQDTYMFCYTSGTTGTPKGAVLSHQNIIAALSGFYKQLECFGPGRFHEADVMMSYLPLSHVFEQVSEWTAIIGGASIGYYRGDTKKLMEDMQLVKPTIFPTVPRVLGLITDQVKKRLAESSGFKVKLFNFAYDSKLKRIQKGDFRHTAMEKLVFKSIRNLTGGRLRYSVVGSAPLAKEVLEMVRVTMGATFLEGYGQTENSALGTLSWSTDVEGGWIGPPAPNSLMKLGDVPELGYFASEGKGEIRIKGPSVTSGYFKDPEKTAELYDEDGFLCTGDIAELLPNGIFKIFDRKKNIFKLAQGEYVAPEKIESVYTNSTVVTQVFVDGDSLERHLVAIVVPDYGIIQKWYKENVEDVELSYKELCQKPEVNAFVLESILKQGELGNLNKIEQVRSVYLESEPFSIENGLITPTHKTKRPEIRKKYTHVRAEMYKLIHQEDMKTDDIKAECVAHRLAL
ncbi:hypothetical protein L596_017355 [Steinernema carpocapsae]|uniref:long-chain-fatty-acid--CoA ligase n=1 Tax=Steinernema carpocapsae TaxID=34508 RepID=A0A4U5N240_STECR|nr:hypothetical protein L596_017355 [Steinernema carpocapsae]